MPLLRTLRLGLIEKVWSRKATTTTGTAIHVQLRLRALWLTSIVMAILLCPMTSPTSRTLEQPIQSPIQATHPALSLWATPKTQGPNRTIIHRQHRQYRQRHPRHRDHQCYMQRQVRPGDRNEQAQLQ